MEIYGGGSMSLFRKCNFVFIAAIILISSLFTNSTVYAASKTLEEGTYTFKNVSSSKMMNNYGGVNKDGNKGYSLGV